MKTSILALSLALAGCSQPNSSTDGPPPPGDGSAQPGDPGATAPQGDDQPDARATSAAVTKAVADPGAFGKLAARIQAAPAQADAILQEAGLSRSEFDAAVYAIASDADAAAAFQAALD